MKSAFDQRNDWRKSIKNGIIPEEIEFAVEMYGKYRDDKSWRASSTLEMLGEMALIYYELINEDKNMLRTVKKCECGRVSNPVSLSIVKDTWLDNDDFIYIQFDCPQCGKTHTIKDIWNVKYSMNIMIPNHNIMSGKKSLTKRIN